MVNQDPQPELYTTRAVFTAANTTGDVATSTTVSYTHLRAHETV